MRFYTDGQVFFFLYGFIWKSGSGEVCAAGVRIASFIAESEGGGVSTNVGSYRSKNTMLSI